MRYQTSSISRKAKPTSAAATRHAASRAAAALRLGRPSSAAGGWAPPAPRASRVGQLAGEAHGGEHHQQVEQRRDPDGLADAQRLEGEEGGEQRAEHRAQRVDAVEQAHGPAAGVGPPLDRPRRRRQRAAHQEGGQPEDEQREQQADDAAPREPQPGAAADRHVEPLDEPPAAAARGRRDGDPRLQPGVEGERRGVAVGPPAQQQAAEAEPGHEDRQHRGRGRGRGAEDQAEHPQPRRLVDQGAESGPEQQEQRAHGRRIEDLRQEMTTKSASGRRN